MGIPKLDSFIKRHANSCMESIVLKNSKLVIEGYAICLSLYFAYYSDTWFYGGDYYEYYSSVCHFFDELKKRNIDAYVVMSGITIDPTKQTKHIKQIIAKNRIMADLPITKKRLASLFVVQVFLDALRQKNIHFFFADDEVDREIASLANYFQCPVLSADSDFYVFKLVGGFIPLTPESRNNLAKEIPVARFCYEKFKRHFSLSDDLLLLFPIFLGNDSYRSPMKLPFCEQPENVLSHIKQIYSFEDVVQDHPRQRYQLIERQRNARQFYTVQPASFVDLEKCKEKLNHPMPTWVFTAYKRGEFQKDLMSFLIQKGWKCRRVVEDIQQESAWEFTREIREVIMAILTPQNSISSTCSDVQNSDIDSKGTSYSYTDPVPLSLEEPEAENDSDYDDSTEDDSNDDSEMSFSDSFTTNDDTESDPEFLSENEEEQNDFLSPFDSEETTSTPVMECVEYARVSGEPTIKKRQIRFKRSLVHNMIDYTLIWKRPDSRRRALLVIVNCCEIKTQLKTVPENLQLAVIATRYWVKKNREYVDYLNALVNCILTCYLQRKRVKPRQRPTSQSLRSLAHAFAHWQCTLHDLIALNQVLNQPYQYTSPAHLFSGSILHYFLENPHKKIHSRLFSQLIKVIM